jgi:hypothetical protein
MRALFKGSLKGNLHYKSQSGDSWSIEQSTGQLMGDRRSFPLLCAIHCAAKYAFLKMKGYKRSEWFVRVNGDDGVILLREEDVSEYLEFISNLWPMNKLKTYVHKRFFSFNSVLWDALKGIQVEIIRWNMVDCIDKFGNRSMDPTLFNEVAEACPSVDREQLWKYFIGNPQWRKQLKRLGEYNPHLNWHLPLALGGLGIRRDSQNYSVTQRQLAAITTWDQGCERSIKKLVTVRRSSSKEKRNVFKLYVSSTENCEKPRGVPFSSYIKPTDIKSRLVVGKSPNFFSPNSLRDRVDEFWGRRLGVHIVDSNESPDCEKEIVL